jgi:hypothetical protein
MWQEAKANDRKVGFSIKVVYRLSNLIVDPLDGNR